MKTARKTSIVIGGLVSLGTLTVAVYLAEQRHGRISTPGPPLPASVRFPPIATANPHSDTEGLLDAQRDAYVAPGLTRGEADQLASQFEQYGLRPVVSYNNTTAIAKIAQECGATPSEVGSAVIGSFRSAHGDPDQTLHIISVLEKYARLYPTAGVWSCASQAARGEIYQNQYLEVRLSTPDYSRGRLVTFSKSHVKELQPILENLYNGAK